MVDTVVYLGPSLIYLFQVSIGCETDGFFIECTFAACLGSTTPGSIVNIVLTVVYGSNILNIVQVKYCTAAIYDFLDTSRIVEARRGKVSEKYPCLNSKTLPAFVKPLLRALTLSFIAMATHYEDDEVDEHEIAECLHDTVKLFFKIVNITKLSDSGLITHPVILSNCFNTNICFVFYFVFVN